MFQSCGHCWCLLLHSTKAKTWTEFGIIFICTQLKQVAYKFTEPYSTWLSQDWGSPSRGTGGFPHHLKNWLVSHPTTLPKKALLLQFSCGFWWFWPGSPPHWGIPSGKPWSHSNRNESHQSYLQSFEYYLSWALKWRRQFSVYFISNLFKVDRNIMVQSITYRQI